MSPIFRLAGLTLGLLGLVLASPTNAQGLFGDNFTDVAPLAIQISGPMRQLARDKSAKPKEHEGTLTLSGSDQRFSVVLQPRGKSRRKSSHCRFPPLWLKFEKSQIRGTRLQGHHKRKLVTHCKGLRSKGDESKVWLEMLAYRILNLVSDNSYRVAPVTVTYVDTNSANKAFTHAGFIIEHKKELAKRTGLDVQKVEAVPYAKLDEDYSALVAAFNLLIGNPDFSLTKGPAGENCCHNTVPFGTSTGNVRSIPYDFDNTGLVKPKYASPPANVSISKVTQRIYRGYCEHNNSISQAMQRILGVQDDIQAIFASHPGLRDNERKRALRYLSGFFERYGSPAQQQRLLVKRCLD